MMTEADIIDKIVGELSNGNITYAKKIILDEYPFHKQDIQVRKYTINDRMDIYIRDGFIDRYSGERLVNPGILKVLSNVFPDEFPYQQHWKMNETHNAYWKLSPTIDHITPISAGGLNCKDNCVTTSMLNNSIKSNWTIEQLGWKLHPPGNIKQWDGLTRKFIDLVKKDNSMELHKDKNINAWYRASIKILGVIN